MAIPIKARIFAAIYKKLKSIGFFFNGKTFFSRFFSTSCLVLSFFPQGVFWLSINWITKGWCSPDFHQCPPAWMLFRMLLVEGLLDCYSGPPTLMKKLIGTNDYDTFELRGVSRYKILLLKDNFFNEVNKINNIKHIK